MKLFVTSDTHFNHTNIIKYCNRPFADVGEMNETLIRNWNNVVDDEDFVIHCGDFGLGKMDKLPSLIQRLNGHKILVVGNHDKSANWYMDNGFDYACNEPLILYDKAINFTYIFSHYPPTSFYPQHYYFYGHIHNNTALDVHSPLNNARCICCDRTDFTPLILGDVDFKSDYHQNMIQVDLTLKK